MSESYDEPPYVLEAVPRRGGRRWLWWVLGIVAACGLATCGGCGVFFYWLASAKPVDLSYPSAQRQGAAIVVRVDYHVKGRSPSIGFTNVIVEGPGWRHRQQAFGGIRIPVTGQITVTVPPLGNQPRDGGSAVVYLESDSQRGGGVERSSNQVSVTIPP